MINVTPEQLRKAANIKERIDALQNELNEILGGDTLTPPTAPGKPKKRKMSAAGRAAIVAAAKARWAKTKGTAPARRPISAAGLANIRAAQKARWAAAKGAAPAAKPMQKRQMSPAARAKLSALAAARWAKVKKAGKSKL
jgi:hypothetical protein